MVRRIKRVEATLPVEYLQRVGYLQVPCDTTSCDAMRPDCFFFVFVLSYGFCFYVCLVGWLIDSSSVCVYLFALFVFVCLFVSRSTLAHS